MPLEDFYKPEDADVLRMENELLAFENRYLKARLVESQEATKRTEKSRSTDPTNVATVPVSRYRRLEMAERDVKYLVGWLSRRPYRWFLGRRKRYRRFLERYGGPEGGDGS